MGVIRSTLGEELVHSIDQVVIHRAAVEVVRPPPGTMALTWGAAAVLALASTAAGEAVCTSETYQIREEFNEMEQ